MKLNNNLGAFSVSLNVFDIKVSKEFYTKLGFEEHGGNIKENWLIMKNGDCIIGLFQGMFGKNILTFNPGWDMNANDINPFIDVRAIQAELKARGMLILNETDPNTKGPGSFILEDPDGNVILFDQHR